MTNKKSNHLKTKLGIIVAFLSIMGAAYFAEDRWNQQAGVRAAEYQIEQVGQETIKSLKNFRKHQELQDAMQRAEWIDDRIIQNKMDLRRYPDDVELKEEKIELKERKNKIKDRIDILMEE